MRTRQSFLLLFGFVWFCLVGAGLFGFVLYVWLLGVGWLVGWEHQTQEEQKR